MTREAKIGLLTGLGVIVLIGVLLSDYLGRRPSPKMATLPIGETYRDQLRQPVGVPGPQVGGANNSIQSPPVAYAVGDSTSVSTPDMDGNVGGPVIGRPVTPVVDGQVVAQAPLGDKVPTFLLPGETRAVSLAKDGPGKPTPMVGKEYPIAPGDTLAKIAMKFYKSAKPENEQRIVAANPGVLKNLNTMLVVGKKLIIPNLPAASVTDAGKTVAKTDGDVRVPKAVVVVHPPGATGTVVEGKSGDSHAVVVKPDAPKKDAVPAIYKVKDGDTLALIAARYVGTGDKEAAGKMVSKIVALNKIKDPGSIQVGMKLKMPAKA